MILFTPHSIKTSLEKTTALTSALALLLAPFNASAAPTGGTVTEGVATITAPNATTTHINQTSQNATINWQSFNVDAEELVKFVAPSTNSVTLNTINDVNASQILGQIEANGQIFLINPNGIIFGENSRVDAAGIVATTSNLNQFDSAAGTLSFQGSGLNAEIINNGTLTATDGGLVALVAPSVQNNGTITARLGKVTLQGGENFTLDLYGDNLITLSAEGDLAQSIAENTGSISASGGAIALSAAQAGNALNNVVNMTGHVEANTVNTQNGRIILGSVGGQTTFSGNAEADSGIIRIGGGWQGGEDLASSTYTTASGNVNVSGNGDANAGSAVIWADETTVFTGNILAQGGTTGGDGGNVEVSGKRNLVFNGNVNTTAANGATGNLLLDPTNITITDGGAGTDDAEVVDATVLQSDGGATDFSISEQSLEALAAGTNISLQATNNITIDDLTDDQLTLASIGSVTFTADTDADGTGDFSMNASDIITTAGANITISGANLTVSELNTTAGTGGNITLFTTNTGNITLLGDLSTTQGDMLINADTLLGSDIAFSTGTGAGNITFGGTLTGSQLATFALGGSGDLTLGEVDIGTLTFTDGNNVSIGGTINTDNALSFAGLAAITLTADTTLISDNAGTKGDVTLSGANKINGAYALSITGDTITLDGMGASTPLTTLTVSADTALILNDDITTTGTQSYTGDTTLSGVLSTTNSNITFLDNLTLAANSTLDTNSAGGNITINGAIEGTTSGGEVLTLNAGTGALNTGSTVGAVTALDTLTASANTLTFNGVTTANNQTYTGDATINGTFSNTSGDITFNDAVTLGANINLDTSSGSGNVTFTDTIDGAFDLIATTGSGQVELQGIVGGVTPLNQVSLSGNGVALNTISTVQGQSFSGALTLNGDMTTTNGGITLTGNVGLGADSTLTAGGTVGDDITITGALTGDNTLNIIAGLADINLNGLDVDTLTLTSGATLNAGGSIVADNALDFTNIGAINISTAANISAFDGTTAADILLDSANTITGSSDLTLLGRNIDLFEVNGVNNLTITSQDGGAVTLNDAITTTGSQTFSGDTTLNGGLATSNADIIFTDNITLNADASFATLGGNITLQGTVDGAQSLTLNAGAGDVLAQAPIGGITPVTNLTALGTNVTLDEVTTTGSLTVTGDATFNGLAIGGSDITIVGDSVLGGGGLATSLGSLTLDGNITLIGDAQLTTGGLSGDDITLTGDTTGDYDLDFLAGLGDIILGGSADVNALTFTSGQDLYLNGGNYTVDTDMTFSALQQILLGADTTLIAQNGATRGDITFAANNPILGAHNLSVTGGILTFNDIGDGTAPNDPLSLTVDGTEVLLLGAVRTAGAQTYTSLDGLANDLSTQGADITINSPLDLLASVTISTGTGAGNILFQDIVDGGFGLTLDAGTGTVTSQGTIGVNTPLTDVTFIGSQIDVENTIITTGTQTFNGPLNLQAGLTTQGGDIFINDTLALAGDTTITTGSSLGGNITFAADVNDSNPLTLIAGTGDISFLAGAGNTSRLNDFTITSANDVTFAEGLYVTSYTHTGGSGDVTFGNAPGLNSTGNVTIIGPSSITGTLTGADAILNPTGSTVATVNFDNLLLGGNTTDLLGIIAGKGGRDAAREVTYITFTGGPHYMNGYTLPLLADFASPQTLVNTALSDLSTPSGVTLNVTDANQQFLNPFTTSFSLFESEENVATIDTDLFTPFWHYYLDDDTLQTLN